MKLELKLAKHKPPRTIDSAHVARRRARVQVGQPPPERVIPDKRKKAPKHKKKWLEEA